ncbi:aminomethyl-transferring glycine dehydrogenase subunit GcvPA [Acidaminobacter sp. JC074]|uniref:aminomethyl-transferring glycine dehydrogenase subunit GcvPA n=1 Tax=Acidaminobacter sp. JC074 TaxID=2530199 RepID=UPI001F107FAD|nr:aminomethyl-transferring glycine dehydrogenase subunit GcvPA [Acidaminobacter sp. JC074]MCH4888863.1 aminomethyl-transferring glycine dehydrogenase subunit GcvPA [Acidaminobacter sp. JC074]
MFPYIPISKADEEKMLQVIGAKSVDELFLDIPENLKVKGPLNLPKHKSEAEVRRLVGKLASKNTSASEALCFLGGGTYDSYIPSIVPYLTSRSEFSTAYTPYQPEISQGTLHGIFEFQTLVSNLTDMDASNASMYDGPTAAAEAALMAFDKSKGDTLFISETVNPKIIQVVCTYLKFREFKIEMIPSKDFITDLDAYKEKVSKNAVGLLVQSPNYFGIVEDYSEFMDITKENKALNIMYADPSSLGILKTPGEYGVDITVGEMQAFGNPMNYGGPHLGFIATTKKMMRKLPGRIVGEGVDANGNRAYVLTLQAREQHIRREKASSNICSNQALNAMGATIYMSLLGKQGIKEIAVNSTNKAHYLYNELLKLNGFEKVTDQPFYREFLVKVKDLNALNKALSEAGIMTVKAIKDDNIVQFTVTENRTKDEIDYLIKSVEVL